jgi:fatty acid desaturase
VLVLVSRGAAAWWSMPVTWLLALHLVFILNEIKGATEHGSAIGLSGLRELRSRSSVMFGHNVFFPCNISVHFEHHLNMWVPWYRLPAYRRALVDIVPPGLHDEIYNTRIGQLWGQLTDRRPTAIGKLAPRIVDTARSTPEALAFADRDSLHAHKIHEGVRSEITGESEPTPARSG